VVTSGLQVNATSRRLGRETDSGYRIRRSDERDPLARRHRYKHNWTDRVRSTLSYGFDNVEDNGFLPPDAVESNHVMSANLMVKFYRAATLGIEYMWGDNRLQNGDDGWAQRIQFGLKYDLTK
jgi:hypothetical protein